MTELKPLVVILGPTASGKTGMALELAKKFQGELVNADSRQIYRGMDIATNKFPGTDMQKKEVGGKTAYLAGGIPIHLLDLADPDRNFTLADYKAAALEAIGEIQSRSRLPILAGGTGLYISAAVDNLSIPEAPPDENLRQELEKKDSAGLYGALERIDPEAADSIGRSNKRKLIRALEVYKATGRPFSGQKTKGEPLFHILEIGIKTPREELYEKIDGRVDEMIKTGLVEETRKLLEKYAPDIPAMSGIGYKEIGAHLRGDISLDEAAQRIKWRTHQYARRQLTWFKRDPRIHWVKGYEEAESLVRNFLK